MSGLTIRHLEFTRDTVYAMKQDVVKSMHAHYRSDFEKALQRDEIIIEIDGQQLIIHKEL